MVSLSVRSKYGLSAVLEVAFATQESPVQVRQIAERNRIPQTYLEQLLSVLKKAGLIKSVRGAHGGYLLAKKPEDVTVLDVLLCLEGPSELSTSFCGVNVLKSFWKTKEKEIEELFKAVSIADLKKDQQRESRVLQYCI